MKRGKSVKGKKQGIVSKSINAKESRSKSINTFLC